MCGIAGILYKARTREGPVARILVEMLEALGSRGTDGTGVALYGNRQEGQVLRVWLGEGGRPAQVLLEKVLAALKPLTRVEDAILEDDSARLVVRAAGCPEPASMPTWISAIADAIEAVSDGVEVFSVGSAMEILKQVGTASSLQERYALAGFQGTHGIGHTRLATASRVDVSHCHPFWARPYPDIAIVHNGQITNYRKMRRHMEMRGARFATDNDSEIIALYLVERLRDGVGLEDALGQSIEDLDGSFTYLVSTAQGIGMAKDAFATKPLVVMETDDWVAIASEERALYAAGLDGPTYEPPAREVRVWLP